MRALIAWLCSVFVSRRKPKRRPQGLPVGECDPETQLPAWILMLDGDVAAAPLVSIQQMRAHLSVLAAFRAWRQRHESEPDLRAELERGAIEYQQWAARGTTLARANRAAEAASEENGSEATLAREDSIASQLPPSLPALMCWHAHMLSPRRYHAEAESTYKHLQNRSFPLEQAATAIRNGSLAMKASHDIVSQMATAASTLPAGTSGTRIWSTHDLVEAVNRQNTFIDNLAKIGWLRARAFKAEVLEMQRAVIRYHYWLDLQHPTKCKHFLVPILDIDLAWHTHQLQGKQYRLDTERYVGQFLDHDDRAGEGRLREGLKTTARLWAERYGDRYLY